MKRFDAVIFDLDGTLANTFPLVLAAFNFAVGSRLGRTFSLKELKPYFGPPEIDIVKLMLADPDDQSAAIKSFHQFNREHGELIERFDGIHQLIVRLKDNGFRLAVCTGAGHQAGADRVRSIGMDHLFERVLGGDEVKNPKPHPEGINLLVEQFGVSQDRTAIVGDSPADIDAGRAAGVTSIAVTWGVTRKEKLQAASPDFICQSVNELEDILMRDRDNE